jgi:outer membrane immunogenic protein
MKKVLLSGVAVLLAAPALAADLPTKKAPIPLPVVTEYDWTGFYFGGNIGGLWGTSHNNTYNTVNGLFVDSDSNHLSSFIGGGQAGYRYMFPQRFVIGAEASLDWFSNGSNSHSLIVNNKVSEWSDWSSGWGGDVVGVAAYAWGDFLPFVKGGWAWSQTTVTHWQILGTVGTIGANNAESASLSRGGWTIGGGLAWHVWSNWEVFGQYMYANYGSANVNFIALQRSTRTSLTTNAVTFGVNLKM